MSVKSDSWQRPARSGSGDHSLEPDSALIVTPAKAEGDGCTVTVRQSVLNSIHKHGLTNTKVEVCGVLVGTIEPTGNDTRVHITDLIRGERAQATTGSVTFTADTWTYIQLAMDERFPDKRIVGWYHTHPDFGIFLSPMDMFIHENFFNLSWQVAMVHDPVRGEHGLFVWKQNKVVAHAFDLEQDVTSIIKSVRRSKTDDDDNDKSLAHHPMIIAMIVALILIGIAAVGFTWRQYAQNGRTQPAARQTQSTSSNPAGGHIDPRNHDLGVE